MLRSISTKRSPANQEHLLSLTLETEIREQSNVFSTLLGFGEIGEYQESPPALAAAHASTLHLDGQIVQVRFRNTSSPHDAPGTDVLKAQVDKGSNYTDGKDPFLDGEVNDRVWIDTRRPLAESEQRDSSKAINTVDGKRYEDGDVKIDVGGNCEPRVGFEVGQILGD